MKISFNKKEEIFYIGKSSVHDNFIITISCSDDLSETFIIPFLDKNVIEYKFKEDEIIEDEEFVLTYGRPQECVLEGLRHLSEILEDYSSIEVLEVELA